MRSLWQKANLEAESLQKSKSLVNLSRQFIVGTPLFVLFRLIEISRYCDLNPLSSQEESLALSPRIDLLRLGENLPLFWEE